MTVHDKNNKKIELNKVLGIDLYNTKDGYKKVWLA